MMVTCKQADLSSTHGHSYPPWIVDFKMLTIYGSRSAGYCDGVSRRSFLKLGGLTTLAGGLSLSRLLAATASPQPGAHASRPKSIIQVYLGGGAPHLDTFDLKPNAPVEIRGEFKPIKTNVPGIEIGELFPRLAQRMHQCSIVRSIVGMHDEHAPHQCYTGWHSNGKSALQSLGGRPSVGAAVARLLGPTDPSVPPFIGLAPLTGHRPYTDPGIPGFLGPSYNAFKPDGTGMANMRLRNVTLDNLQDRKQLMGSFDSLKKQMDSSRVLESADSSIQRAMEVLTSSRLVDALDLSKEDPRLRDRYGTGQPYQHSGDGAPTNNEQLLIARRLVEAGARVVSLTYGFWDGHGGNFPLMRDHGSKLDQCLSALLEDLEQRGLSDDVCVIVWGEFGRTPRINKDAGRDHWPQVNCALLAGGGLRTGQVVGSTNRLGEYAQDRPVHFADVVSTLYHTVGIDTSKTTLTDPTGRPQFLVEGTPIKELV